MKQESYIKFKCKHLAKDIQFPADIHKLISIGDELKKHSLIGKIDEDTGFGNISFKEIDNNIVYISASKTGTYGSYKEEHFSKIIAWDAENNYVESAGLLPASSETLSHLAIYEALPWANCVAHVHSEALWNKYRNTEITSNDTIEYGTKEMYFEIVRLLKGHNESKLLVMGGHHGGLLVWDKDFNSLKETITTYLLSI